MVQLMKRGKVAAEKELRRGKMGPVKVEKVEDPFEEDHAPLHKRSKLSSASSLPQHDLGNNAFHVPPSQYNPLDEPSPLGLRLRKSPSLLELIQMRLSHGINSSKDGVQVKKEQKGAASSGSSDKLKASNFPATILKIGTWEYKSRYEGDLVAKCYFAKHKLVWEVLDGGLKNKIEIQWSDIMGMKATYPDDEPGTLDVVLARQPLFFRETNPQPRKHTLWQATSDFTGGQASINRRHYLQCPQGLLGKHFEKLIQCDPRLNYLSQQADIILESSFFEPQISGFDELGEASREYDMNSEGGPAIFELRDATSPSGPQSSSSRNEQHDFVGRHPEHFPRETPSPSSVMDSGVVEEIKTSANEGLRNLGCWDHIRVPGLHPSMSMSDLVNHIENRFSERRMSTNPVLSNEERESLEILDEISRCLFTDSQHAPTSDEKSIMSRVDSLCCLLQKDHATVQDFPFKSGYGADMMMTENKSGNQLNSSTSEIKSEVAKGSIPGGESNDASGSKQELGMPRNDSVGELLLNLPRIASLPQFFFNISEDFNNQAR